MGVACFNEEASRLPHSLREPPPGSSPCSITRRDGGKHRLPDLPSVRGQREKIGLGRLLGQAKQRSDSSQGQAGMKHEPYRLTPSLSHSTSTSKP